MTSSTAEFATATPRSAQKLALAVLICMVVGSMVGSGIFSLPHTFGLATGHFGGPACDYLKMPPVASLGDGAAIRDRWNVAANHMR
jgi:hypothetical protein